MTGPPDIVRHRLAQAGGAQGVDHPEANLLAGFIDHSLTSRERTSVLDHLAQCAECREQVALALPKVEAEVMAARAAAARRWPVWLRWPVLRWGLLVASLAIMGTVALVRPPPAPRLELASRANVPPRSAAPLPSDATVGAAPGRASKPASQPSQEAAGEFAVNLAQTKKRENREYAAQVQLAVRAREMAGTFKAQKPVRVPAKAFRPSPSATNSGGSKQLSTTVVAQALPPPPALPPRAAPPPAPPTPQASDLLASAQPKKDESSRASEEYMRKSVGGPVGGAVGGVVQTPPVETPSRRLVGSLIAPKARPVKLAESNSGSAEVSNLITPAWSISASGRIQRSVDGGKTWEELDVDRNVVFRVVFAVGPDVWLGGTKGALYHSTDGGQHWTRVSIARDSTIVTDDIIRIQFKDAQHGTVKTGAGDTWITADTGQHWQKQG